ncbi:MAG: hypothetical protein AAFX06_04480 [Planctomycetota bacterium]
MPRPCVRLCVTEELELRKLLAADALSGDADSQSMCLAYGDPHAAPTPIAETASDFMGALATTELPPHKVIETQDETALGQTEVESVPAVGTDDTQPNDNVVDEDPSTDEPPSNEIGDVTEESSVEETPSETTTAPQVAQIDFGSAQRSVVNGFVIAFDAVVDVDTSQNDVVRVVRRGSQEEVNVTTTVETMNDATIICIQFEAGPAVETSAGAPSLADGNYELTINASRVSVGGTALDGNGDGVGGDDYVYGDEATDGFFRLFGDQDGDRDVDDVDYEEFVAALLSTTDTANYDARFDSNEDGDVDGQDYGQYLNRHGTSLDFA